MTELEQFCILARTQKSRACAALIQQVIGHRKIFVFGELLALPSVASLKDSEEFSGAYRTLELFAYGSYMDYAQDTSKYLELSGIQLAKLKQLSVVSIAAKEKVVPYSAISSCIGLKGFGSSSGGGEGEGDADVRELEDIVMECIYSGLLAGRLDQRQRLLRVQSVMARDVRPEDIGNMIQKLSQWSRAFSKMMTALQKSSSDMQAHRVLCQKEQDETQGQAGAKMEEIKRAIESGDLSMDIDDGAVDYASSTGRRPFSGGSNNMSSASARKYAAGHKQARRQLGGPGVGSGGGGSRGPM